MSAPVTSVATASLAAAATASLLLLGLAVFAARRVLRSRCLDRWLGTYVLESRRRAPPPPGRPVHVLLCVADHYEPQHGKVDATRSAARVAALVENYPRLFGRLRDTDERPPRPTLFFPIDEYEASHVDRLAALCRAGYAEAALHHL